MALMCRRKAFSGISRYRLCGRFSFSSSSSADSSSSLPCFPRPSSVPQMQASHQLWPAMAMAMHSSLAAPLSAVRTFTTSAFQASKCTTSGTPCCFTRICTTKRGCSCSTTGGLLFSSRNCTTTAYPPPTPPCEFQGGDEELEADGAKLNLDEAAGDGAFPPEGSEDFNMPPYDDANLEDEDGDYEEADPPPDPEETLLYSPSDED